MHLQGKVAVVTGGGTGIGRAISQALAGAGAAVGVNYSRSEAAAEATVRAIEEGGGAALAIQADVSQDAEARRLITETVERFGRLDILVNNAGYTQRVPHPDLEGLTEELLDKAWAVNTKGPLYCARAAIPLMRETGGGSILNITSQAAITGTGSSMIYGAAKAALSALTKSLARAFAPDIRVNAIAPGFVDTGFGGWPPETAETARQQSHLGRVVTVEDVAALALFVVSDGCALTGEEIVLDGGLIALGKRA